MTETILPRYIRHENVIEVYDTDERGPGIAPVDRQYVSFWTHVDGRPITDPELIARLNRDYPPTGGE